MDKEFPKRTVQQNKALHVLFELLASELNERGLDMRRTLKETIDIPWSRASVKEYLWKPVQKAQLDKQSTTELTTKEIDQVFDTLNRFIGEKFSFHVGFPSIEDIILDIQAKEKNDPHSNNRVRRD